MEQVISFMTKSNIVGHVIRFALLAFLFSACVIISFLALPH